MNQNISACSNKTPMIDDLQQQYHFSDDKVRQLQQRAKERLEQGKQTYSERYNTAIRRQLPLSQLSQEVLEELRQLRTQCKLEDKTVAKLEQQLNSTYIKHCDQYKKACLEYLCQGLSWDDFDRVDLQKQFNLSDARTITEKEMLAAQEFDEKKEEYREAFDFRLRQHNLNLRIRAEILQAMPYPRLTDACVSPIEDEVRRAFERDQKRYQRLFGDLLCRHNPLRTSDIAELTAKQADLRFGDDLARWLEQEVLEDARSVYQREVSKVLAQQGTWNQESQQQLHHLREWHLLGDEAAKIEDQLTQSIPEPPTPLIPDPQTVPIPELHDDKIEPVLVEPVSVEAVVEEVAELTPTPDVSVTDFPLEATDFDVRPEVLDSPMEEMESPIMEVVDLTPPITSSLPLTVPPLSLEPAPAEPTDSIAASPMPVNVAPLPSTPSTAVAPTARTDQGPERRINFIQWSIWLGVFLAIPVAGTIAFPAYQRWQADQAANAAFQHLRHLQNTKDYEGCLSAANAFPSTSHLSADAAAVKQQCLLEQSQALLSQAQGLDQQEKWTEAVASARKVKSETPAYAEAQRLIQAIDQKMWSQARKYYVDEGKLDQAIDLLQQIATVNADDRTVKAAIEALRREWDTNKKALDDATKELQKFNQNGSPQNARKRLEEIKITWQGKSVQSPHWDKLIKPRMEKANQQIQELELAKARANPVQPANPSDPGIGGPSTDSAQSDYPSSYPNNQYVPAPAPRDTAPAPRDTAPAPSTSTNDPLPGGRCSDKIKC